ncbi:MAG: EAL domain-containing protein [Lachnospiraceae bacterium]|nr:EAL domain-containing protein [Lachnospiraceae bacterium]
MFVNKLNQVYKPERILYYIEPEESVIDDARSELLPEAVKQYAGAFGTYDRPGIFYIRKLHREVFGIEYRMEDPRISYPKDLSSMVLPEAFFYSVELDDDTVVTRESIRGLFEEMAKDGDAHRLHSDLRICGESGITAVFFDYRKKRILSECRLEEDRAKAIILDDRDAMNKDALFRMAFCDPITGHYTWNHLVAFLEMPMHKGIRDYAFVHFDIKEFRVINEVYGHVTANRVLCRVVQAMKDADFVYTSARCHNDNFAMMIRDMSEEETRRRLEEFFAGLSVLEEDPYYRIYFRCGVVPMARAVLMGNRVADAGKMAQALGLSPKKTDIIIYNDQMHNDISWGNYIKAYVDTAVAQDEFVVYLQPKFDIRTETINGAEALIRWNYKNKELLPPGRFIPFFEKDGSIGKIDRIVLEKVCEAMARWKKEGKRLVPVSVNLSRNRMYDERLIEHLTETVDKYGVEHGLIDFELTESATYDNREHMIRVLEELRKEGFEISMDDFGTGYSSLSLLTEMPIDTLKIDKSFVDKVGIRKEKKEDIVVINSIISLAKELGLCCLAEGAETGEQVDRLRELGCETIQGFYYSRPIPIPEFEKRYFA